MENKLVANAIIIVLLMISTTTTPPSIVADGHGPICGSQCGGKLCPLDNVCCSKLGYCGWTDDYCLSDNGCQSGACRNTTIVRR
ncbi:HEV1 [Linum perenne]